MPHAAVLALCGIAALSAAASATPVVAVNAIVVWSAIVSATAATAKKPAQAMAAIIATTRRYFHCISDDAIKSAIDPPDRPTYTFRPGVNRNTIAAPCARAAGTYRMAPGCFLETTA